MTNEVSLPLVDFLKNSKNNLLDGERTVHVVIGNEACDLDSAVSSIVYAYLLHLTHPTSDDVFIPVLNIAEADYRIRTEVTFSLNLRNITQDLLSFRDHINFDDLHEKKKKLKLTLVDFNIFRGSDQRFESAVCEVLDHHEKERIDDPKIDCRIEPVGSCCTLVTEAFLRHQQLQVSDDIFWLLYGTILLDTVCLSESAGRTTAKDMGIIQLLETKLHVCHADRQAVFDKLQAAKFDMSSLTTTDVLNKDLKTVKGEHIIVAISSIPIPLEDLLSRGDTVQTVSEFCLHHKAAVLVLMSLYMDDVGEPCRQLAIYSNHPTLKDQLCMHLEKPSLDLHLAPLEILSSGFVANSFRSYTQTNVKASRKIVLPIVKDWILSNTRELE